MVRLNHWPSSAMGLWCNLVLPALFVYGDGAENWVKYRPALQSGWRAQKEIHGRTVESWQLPTGVAENVSMDEVELSPCVI